MTSQHRGPPENTQQPGSMLVNLTRSLGYLGLCPFLGLPLLGWMGILPAWREAFDAWSAVVLSFMAGVYWALAVGDRIGSSPHRLAALAVGLALFGWLALAMPPELRALVYGVAFLLVYVIDRFVLSDYWPNYYLEMRLQLTSVVTATQATMLAVA